MIKLKLKITDQLWIDTILQFYTANEYHKELLITISEHFGKEAYICDDGTISKDVLIAKVPELVLKLLAERDSK